MKTWIPALGVIGALLGAGAASAAAEDAFTYELTVRNITEQLIITYRVGKETMLACTPEQRGQIEARGIERLNEMSKALFARSLGRGDPAGTTVKVELDAACYEGGFMGLAGLGRGAEKIEFPYEEKKLGGEWGPPTDQPVQ